MGRISGKITFKEPENAYALSCRIERDGKLEFINDTRFNINGAATLDIFVIKV